MSANDSMLHAAVVASYVPTCAGEMGGCVDMNVGLLMSAHDSMLHAAVVVASYERTCVADVGWRSRHACGGVHECAALRA